MGPGGAVLRRAVPDDAERLAACEIACWREAYAHLFDVDALSRFAPDVRVQRWQEILAAQPQPGVRVPSASAPADATWVAEEAGEIIGFARSGRSRDEPADPPLELKALYVREVRHGSGVGRWLLLAAAQRHAVSAWVFEANPRARAFYAREGLRPIGEPQPDPRTGVPGVRLVRAAYPERLELLEVGAERSGTPVRLERFRIEAHGPGLIAVCGDPEVQRFLGGAMTPADVLMLCGRLEDHWEAFGFGLWAVVPAGGDCSGFVGACHPLWHPAFADEVEVGWRLGRDVWGRGIATRGAVNAAQGLFTREGLDRLVAFVRPENARSLAVCRRLAMRTAGTTTDPQHGHRLEIHELRRQTALAGGPRS